ncbi:MAG TPA: hypothetical protein VKV05_14770 [Terriglobales bacterium]|nr:hypothetical protein [Terriglobales bacterium]
MNPIHFLDAAYLVAWVVYLGYLGRILLCLKRVEEEKKEFDRSRQPQLR